MYLAAKYRPHGVYANARSVIAIHNLRHQVGRGGGAGLLPELLACLARRARGSQARAAGLSACPQPRPAPSLLLNLHPQGVFPPHSFKELGLPGHWYGAVEFQYPPHQVGPWGRAGGLVGGLVGSNGCVRRDVVRWPTRGRAF